MVIRGMVYGPIRTNLTNAGYPEPKVSGYGSTCILEGHGREMGDGIYGRYGRWAMQNQYDEE
jgi:hypothetical protein